MLLSVNHKDGKPILIKGKLLKAGRGESILSLDSWAKEFGKGWSIQKVRTFFKLLEDDMMITRTNEGVTTRLNICNYDAYQTSQHPNNTKDAPKATSKQHALNTHLTTNNNGNNVNNGNNENKKSNVEYSTDFLAFWQSYPIKKGKGAAFNSWKRIKGRPDISELIKAIDEQQKGDSWCEDNGKYIPHPTTWLNQRRWEDEVTDPAAAKEKADKELMDKFMRGELG